MQLSIINGNLNLSGKFFYFAADTIYFDLYGKGLSLSLKNKAPWSQVHVHLFNPSEEQLKWCKSKKISFTFESVDISDDEKRKTYYACVRFIRIPEIFNDSSNILSLDCDQLANKNIPEIKFDQDTSISKVTVKKNGRALASAIGFGKDNFRHEYRNRLLSEFENDNIYWFLDQDILDQLISERKVETMGFDWTGTKMTENQMMWTAKGERKNSKQQYVDLLNYYNARA